jgi:hypothetical protein
MIAPELLTTPVYEAVYGGVAYRIEGAVVPVLHVELQETPVYFEHHILLWKEPAVQVRLKSLKRGVPALPSGHADPHNRGQGTRTHHLQSRCRRARISHPPPGRR